MLYTVHYKVVETGSTCDLAVEADSPQAAANYTIAFVRVVYDRSIELTSIDEDIPELRSAPLFDKSNTLPPFFFAE